MANGSFGLSGFPAATTTSTSTAFTSGNVATNPTTPVTTTVQSADGFATGELIYQRRNSFGTIPDNVVATSVFTASQAVPVIGYATSEQVESSSATNLGVNGNNKKAQYAAKLTSGNIVVVFNAAQTSTATGWVQTQNRACFKILTENGATVVDTTCIDTTNAVGNGVVGVVALSTGGFVVAFKNSTSGFIRYGVYTNTGSVTTALQDDSGSGALDVTNYYLMLGARSDGNWVLAVCSTGGAITAKVYSNTGAQVYAWTSTLSTAASGTKQSMIVRSDNTVVIFSIQSGTLTNAQYVVLSTTNTTTVSNTTFAAGFSVSTVYTSAALLSSGSIIFTGFDNSSTIYYRTLTSGNVLSSSATLIDSFSSLGEYSTIGTSSGGFFLVGQSSSNGSYPIYIAYDSSFVASYAQRNLTYLGYNTVAGPLVIDTGTYYGVFALSARNTTSGDYFTLSRFNKTTLLPVNYTDSTLTSGTTSAYAVSGYSRSGSTPSGAAFVASVSATATATVAQTSGSAASFVAGPTQIASSGTFYDMDSTTFADGRFGFVTRTSTGVVTAYIYTVDGSLITAFAVTTGAATGSTVWYTKMVELADGKLVITYPTTGNVVNIAVYSTAYALLGSTSFTPGSSGTQYNIGLAAISGNRILVAYSNSSTYCCFRVFSNAPAQLTAENIVLSTASSGFIRCAPQGNGFVIGFGISATSTKYYSYYESATNTWTSLSAYTYNGTTPGHTLNPKMNSHPALLFDTTADNTAGSTTVMLCATSSTNFTNQFTVTGTAGSAGIFANTSCVTSLGAIVLVQYNSTSVVSLNAYSGPNATSAGSAVSLSIAVASPYLYRLTPNKGNRVVFSYLTTGGLPYFVIFDAQSTPLAIPITSGVTPSAPALALNQATGYTLLGVSTTAAPAGGTGTVQINGPATLNSNYSTTQSATFDFQNPVTYGVKGVVNGRNVNLQGNV
jgi:hypothetical protein